MNSTLLQKMEQIDNMTKQFRKQIVKLMKSKGYEYTTSRTSALGEWQFKKEGQDVFCVCGWVKDLKIRMPYAIVLNILTCDQKHNYKTPLELDMDTASDIVKLDPIKYQKFLDGITNFANNLN